MIERDVVRKIGTGVVLLGLAACSTPDAQSPGSNILDSATASKLLLDRSNLTVDTLSGTVSASLEDVSCVEEGDSMLTVSLQSQNGEKFNAGVCRGTVTSKDGSIKYPVVLLVRDNEDVFVIPFDGRQSLSTDGKTMKGQMKFLDASGRLAPLQGSAFEMTTNESPSWLQLSAEVRFNLTPGTEDEMTQLVKLLTLVQGDVSALEATSTSSAPTKEAAVNTPKPTATKDPMEGAPDWADGVDTIDGKEVFYKLGTDGKTHNYDSGFKDLEGNSILISNHIKGSEYIPMMPGGGDIEEGFPMQFFVQDGLDLGFISHTPGSGMKAGGYMGAVEMVLYNRYKLEHPGTTRQDFWNDIWPGQYKVTVTDAEGNVHSITSDTAFKIILVDREIISNPDFQIPKKNPEILSRTIFDHKANTVNILVANTKSALSDVDFMNTLLFPFGHIMVFSDLSQGAWWADPGKAMNAGTFSNMALKDQYISPPKTP